MAHSGSDYFTLRRRHGGDTTVQASEQTVVECQFINKWQNLLTFICQNLLAFMYPWQHLLLTWHDRFFVFLIWSLCVRCLFALHAHLLGWHDRSLLIACGCFWICSRTGIRSFRDISWARFLASVVLRAWSFVPVLLAQVKRIFCYFCFASKLQLLC